MWGLMERISKYWNYSEAGYVQHISHVSSISHVSDRLHCGK